MGASLFAVSVRTAQIVEQMEARSGSGKTLLIIAAMSGDQMTFRSCVQNAQIVLNPKKVRAANVYT